jgi:hypothetical protein
LRSPPFSLRPSRRGERPGKPLQYRAQKGAGPKPRTLILSPFQPSAVYRQPLPVALMRAAPALHEIQLADVRLSSALCPDAGSPQSHSERVRGALMRRMN